MTTEEKIQIQAFRKVGMGYKQISKEMGISVNSIKSFCQRNGLGEAKNGPVCEQCGKAVLYMPKKKKKRFCSDSCRQAWWNSHLDMVKRRPSMNTPVRYAEKSSLFTAIQRESTAVMAAT